MLFPVVKSRRRAPAAVKPHNHAGNAARVPSRAASHGRAFRRSTATASAAWCAAASMARPGSTACSSTPRQGAGSRRRRVARLSLAARHVRIDRIADPAEQFAAIVRDRPRRQSRVVDAAQPQADHQDHRQAQQARNRAGIEPVGQRHHPAADAFDDDDVRARRELRECRRDHCGIDAHAGIGRGEVRRDRGFERIRIARRVIGLRIAGVDQGQCVLVAQAFGRLRAAAGDRFHAAGAQPRGAQRVQQRAGNVGLADAGVGAGDEDAGLNRTGASSRRHPDDCQPLLQVVAAGTCR